MHTAITSPAGTAVFLLVVLVVLGVWLGWCEYRNQVRALRHDLGMVRRLVACGDLDAARRVHGRADSRARWLRADLADTDVMLLGFGPLSLIEPAAAPRFAVVNRARIDTATTTRMRALRT